MAAQSSDYLTPRTSVDISAADLTVLDRELSAWEQNYHWKAKIVGFFREQIQLFIQHAKILAVQKDQYQHEEEDKGFPLQFKGTGNQVLSHAVTVFESLANDNPVALNPAENSYNHSIKRISAQIVSHLRLLLLLYEEWLMRPPADLLDFDCFFTEKQTIKEQLSAKSGFKVSIDEEAREAVGRIERYVELITKEEVIPRPPQIVELALAQVSAWISRKSMIKRAIEIEKLEAMARDQESEFHEHCFQLIERMTNEERVAWNAVSTTECLRIACYSDVAYVEALKCLFNASWDAAKAACLCKQSVIACLLKNINDSVIKAHKKLSNLHSHTTSECKAMLLSDSRKTLQTLKQVMHGLDVLHIEPVGDYLPKRAQTRRVQRCNRELEELRQLLNSMDFREEITKHEELSETDLKEEMGNAQSKLVHRAYNEAKILATLFESTFAPNMPFYYERLKVHPILERLEEALEFLETSIAAFPHVPGSLLKEKAFLFGWTNISNEEKVKYQSRYT